MVVRLNTMLYMHIWLGIQRCDGPGRHRMLSMPIMVITEYG